MAPTSHDLPQAVIGDGLEPTHPGQQYASTAGSLAPPYNEQYAKDNNSPPVAAIQSDAGRKRRVLGLPVLLFWGIVVGLVLILAIGLGVGLGVGLSQRSSSGGSAASTSAAATTSAASSTPSSSTAGSSTTTTSTTTSATSAAATARNVEICNQASLVSDCTNLTVPVNTCGMPPSASCRLEVASSQSLIMLTYYLESISRLPISVQR